VLRLLPRAVLLAVVLGALGATGRAIADAPLASFVWFPVSPHTGEPVSLVSSSIDPTTPITGFAWDLTGGGAFAEGGPVTNASFSTAGSHVVQLRVTAADGLSSIATETIQVSAPPADILLPFPIVRIVASESASGIKLRLLSVEAPPGARIEVACRGRGCPLRSESRTASVTSVGTVTLRFKRLESRLPAGVVLEVRVSESGRIGKYTRFAVRRGRPPARADGCLDPKGVPIACPSYAIEG
jgi:hypothetical protein